MKRRHAGLALLGAIASFAGGGAARAQDLPGYGPAPGYGGAARNYGDPDAAQDTSRHVTVDVIGDLIYDSNVARGDAAVAAARGLVPGDEIFTPTVSIDAFLPIGREAVFLRGNAGYDFYRQNHILDRERIDLHGGGIARLGPCREEATGDFNRQQSDLEELALQTTKNVENTETLGANAVCGRQTGLAPFVGVSRQWEDNSAQLLRPSDHQTWNVNWGLGYSRPALGSLQLFGNYSSTVFQNSALEIGNSIIKDGYSVVAGGVTFDHRLGARIEGTVSVSYTSLSFDFAGSKGFQGLTYSAFVTYRASGRLGADLHFTRATLPSNSIDATFTLDDLLVGDIHYRLGPRISLALGGSRDSRDAEGPPPMLVPIIESTRQIDYTGFGAATYTLSRRLTLTLDVRKIQRDANIAEFSYGDTRVDLTASTVF